MSAGHIYVVEVRPGVCKVGRSAHRLTRVNSYGSTRTELLAWVSPRFAAFRGAETELIAHLGKYCAVAEGTETFDIDFTTAVSIARTFVVDEQVAA